MLRSVFKDVFFRTVVVFSLFISSFATLYAQQVDIVRLADNIANISAEPLYNYDVIRIKNVIEQFIKQGELIDSISILDSNDKSLFFQAYKKDKKIIESADLPDEITGYKSIERNMLHNNEVIGKLIIYYHYDFDIALNQQEKDWILKHPVINFISDPDAAPLEYIDHQTGHHAGIISSYLDLVSKKTGIVFKLAKVKNWSQGMQEIKTKNVDMFSGIKKTPSREKFLNFSNAYTSYPIVMITRQNQQFLEDINALNGKQVVVIKDYAITELLQKKHPKILLTTVKTTREALQKVSDNEAYAFVSLLPVASYQINKYAYFDLKIAGKTDYTISLSIALRNDWDSIGITIINKALASISEKEKRRIYDKWVAITYDKQVDYTLLWQGAAIALLIISLILYWTRTLARLNASLSEQKQTFQTIYNEAVDSILLVSEGKIVDCNNATVKLLKFQSKDDIINTRLLTLNSKSKKHADASPDSLNEMMRRAILFGATNFECEYRKSDGENFWVDVAINKIFINKKEFLHVRLKDIQSQKELETKLVKAKVSAQQASRSKSDFLANMSHEIRTPMNAILGFTDLLDAQIEDAHHKSYTKTIKTAGNSLLTLINDILDLSKIEAGKIVIDRKASNPYELFKEIKEIFTLKMQEKGLDFIIDIDEYFPKSILIDEVRLRQIILNLVGNAIKFTSKGYIKLSAKILKLDKTSSSVDFVVEIEDSGIGIKADQLQKIFNSFEQQNGQSNKEYGGTGLGLSISRRLAELMDGKIEVKSTEGRGSTFRVIQHNVKIASLIVDLDEEDNSCQNILFKPAAILVVDDIDSNRELIKQNLNDTQITILTAENGLVATKMVKKNSIDLILMDIRMPVMDGYKAARIIRENIPDLPIVALTASVMDNEFTALKKHNFDGHLRKPVKKTELFSQISRFLEYELLPDEVVEKEVIELSPNSKENIAIIMDLLQKNISPLIEQAAKTNNINNIKEIAHRIMDIAMKYDVGALEAYAQHLYNAVENFDIAEIQILLKNYADLERDLRACF